MASYQLEILNDDSAEVIVLDEPIGAVEVVADGPQGPAGPQNLYAGPTPPENPFVGLVWADTSV